MPEGLAHLGLTIFVGGRGRERFRRAGDLARRAEAAGFGAVWTGELYSRSATIPMATLGLATERVTVGSNIAYGVGRAPLVWAVEARDLDELTEGRLVLGLGNGTSGMMENWLSTDGASPATRMEELVTVLRALWRLHEGPVHHDGRFYRVHIAPPATVVPPYREHLPIWTAGVGPAMVRVAGRVADGLVAHPMTTPEYLDEAIRPELERGAEQADRSLEGFVVKGMRMCAVDDDVEAARWRIAVAISQYAASRVYDRLFALHGWEAAQERIRAAARDGDPRRMAAEVPDEAVDAIGIACRPDEFPERVLRARGAVRAPRPLRTAVGPGRRRPRARDGLHPRRRDPRSREDRAVSETWTTLRVDRPRDGVVVLTLDRPDRLNAMTATMFDELENAALTLDREEGLRVLVLTGAGRAFCAGYDLADAEALPSLGALGMLDLQERAARALAAVRGIRVPVIATIHGAAAGGGLALALAADIRLASPMAKFNAAFVKIGLSAGDLGTSWLLPRLIGPAAAAEFVYTGRLMEADEAERCGLVNRVVPAEELQQAALDMADQNLRQLTGRRQALEAGAAGQHGDHVLRGRPRAGEPRPGPPDPHRRHARGPGRASGRSPAEVLRALSGGQARWALLAAEAALLVSRASVQSSVVMEVSPAKVPGPASIWPPSMAIVCPVR